MKRFTHFLKRISATMLLSMTLLQAGMPVELVYARRNNPDKFVLDLEKVWDQKIDQRQASLIFRTLHLFPQTFYKSLNNIVLNFKDHRKNPRGRANSSKVLLEAGRMSDPEMLAVFVHELGHVYDLGSAVGHSRRPSRFKLKSGKYVKADDPSARYYDIAWQSSDRHKHGIQRARHFASTYGASSPFEDFGEAFAFYVLHGDEFAKRAKTNPILQAKYDHLWIRVFGGQRFAFSTGRSYPRVFFDVTKLPYNFAKMLSLADKKRRALAADTNARRRREGRRRVRTQRQARIRLSPIAGL